MIDQILSTLKKDAAPQLISKLGLSDAQASDSVNAAASSVQEVLGGKGINASDIAGLFGDGRKGDATSAIEEKLGSSMIGNLMHKAGLSQEQASKVQALLMPMLVNMVSKHVGGDGNKLQGLLAGLGGGDEDIADKAKGMLGGLFGKR